MSALHGGYGVTKEFLVAETKKLCEEAFSIDPYQTEENLQAVLGRTIFVYHLLTVRELTAVRRALFPIVLEGRGMGMGSQMPLETLTHHSR